MKSKTQRMGYERPKPKYRWRDYLTEEEEARIAEIDNASRSTAQMRDDLIRIRNRAAQRALRAHTRALLRGRS